MKTKLIGDSPISTPVQPTETFGNATICTISPNDVAELEKLRGPHHARREVDAYLDCGTSPLYQPAVK